MSSAGGWYQVSASSFQARSVCSQDHSPARAARRWAESGLKISRASAIAWKGYWSAVAEVRRHRDVARALDLLDGGAVGVRHRAGLRRAGQVEGGFGERVESLRQADEVRRLLRRHRDGQRHR